jgi:O6-methylguanine-DNA--protein-cysteine methyltransferase
MILEYLDTIIAFVVIMLGVSLLITILSQMFSALLGFRGTNLLWGIQTLLKTIDPNLENDAKELATKVLTKPFISDSIFSKLKKLEDVPLLGWLTGRWRLASAVSPEELVRSLRNHAESAERTADYLDKGPNNVEEIEKALEALIKLDPKYKEQVDKIRPKLRTTADPELVRKLKELAGSIRKNAEGIKGVLKLDPEAQRKAQMVQNAFKDLAPGYTVQVDKIVQQLGTSLQESIGQVEAWFNIIMKRTSQRFALQIRICTIVFAALIAFGAHLDSFNILQTLWGSPGLRASLVSERDTYLKEASVILPARGGTGESGGPGVPPQILGDSMKHLIDKEKEATAGLSAMPRFNNLDEAINWLRTGLKVDQRRKEDLIAEYKDLVFAELKEHADRIGQKLKEAGFPLQIPASWKDLINYKGLSILGILVTAGFLSLGAPFWFNTLKTLSNLRPLVANLSGQTASGSTQS